jgi:lipopolysaccharide transport system ATP-binding protein
MPRRQADTLASMNHSYGGYQIRYRVDPIAASPAGWVILDDFFPNLLTGFRIAEYNAYLQRFPRLTICSTLPNFAMQLRRYSRLYPQLAPRVRRFSGAAAPAPSFAYLNFLNNALAFLPYLEARKIPFVFTLYPGGGFGIDDRACDDKLDRVCASPCLKHVVVTQKRTAEYLHARHPAVPWTFVYGCVVNSLYFPDAIAPRVRFGDGKATFDICFVAEKYMLQGRNKGYPVCIDAARRVAAAIPETRLHVVGGFIPGDWPLGELAGKVTFHGRLTTQALREFFLKMDVIASPNVPFTLHAGNFDGFPTAACAEASLCGVAMVVADVLDLNTEYRAGRELVIAAPEVETFAEALLTLGREPERLRSLALAGQQKSRALFAPERQIPPRLAVIEREAQACGATL